MDVTPTLTMIVGAPSLPVTDEEAVRELLGGNQPRARRWWWTWVGTFSAVTVGEGVLALTATDPDARASDLIGGASSLVGVVNLLVSPYPALHARKNLAGIGSAEELTALFERTAAAERLQTGPLAHVGSFVVSAAPAAVVWLVYDRPEDAVVALVGGLALGEGQILTSPRHVQRAWRDRPAVEAWVVPSPDGVVLAGRF